MLYIYVFQLWVFQKEFSCSFFINPLIFLWCFHFSSFFTCINRRCYLKSVIWYSFFTFKLLNGCIFIFSLQFSQLSMQHFIDQRPFFSFSQSHYFMRNFVTELSNCSFKSVSTEAINESKIRRLHKRVLKQKHFEWTSLYHIYLPI